MPPHSQFILRHVARFGALRYHQLEALCRGALKRTSIYKHLKVLRRKGLVKFHDLHDRRSSAIVCTEDGQDLIFGAEGMKSRAVRMRDLGHTLTCADVAIELYHRPHVLGIATEFELCSQDLDGVLEKRTPDALATLRQDTHDHLIGVEVETSLRSEARVKEVLSQYDKAMSSNSRCTAVIIVCCDPYIYQTYLASMGGVTKEHRENFLIFDSPRLSGLSAEAFGERQPSANESANASWNSSAGVFVPFSIKTGGSPRNNQPRKKSDSHVPVCKESVFDA